MIQTGRYQPVSHHRFKPCNVTYSGPMVLLYLENVWLIQRHVRVGCFLPAPVYVLRAKAYTLTKVFNHILRVQDTNLINVKYLWRFVARGAMVLCANDQERVILLREITPRTFP